MMEIKWKIFKNIGEKQVIRFDAFSLPALVDIYSATANPLQDKNHQYKKNNLTDSVNEALMNELGYLAVCIDEKNNVVKTYGDTGKYLLQKNFNLNLPDLLPKSLATAFFTASRTALKSNEKVVVKGINIKSEETKSLVAQYNSFIIEPEIKIMADFFDNQIKVLLLEATFLEAELARTASRLVSMDSAQNEAEKYLTVQELALLNAQRSIQNARILETIAAMHKSG